jgi:uncharacterized membrane protein YvbJ
MVNALCPRCGTPKKRPWKKCSNCGLDPANDEDALVKSVYLSVERFEDADDRRRHGKEMDELAIRFRLFLPVIIVVVVLVIIIVVRRL